MFPWFIWNGIDSRDMGLWITALPPIVRAKERTTEIKVPGRAGSLTITEGENVHDSYVKECIVTVSRRSDLQAILAWLSGDGYVIFSNEENKLYEARIAGEISFQRISNTLAQATIPFYVNPHKHAYPEPLDITLAGTSGRIGNPGDIDSLPIITVHYTGSIEISIGNIGMIFSSIPGQIVVDCSAQIITLSDGTLWTGDYTGEFWKIKKGSNVYTMSESGCTLVVKPEWRWL